MSDFLDDRLATLVDTPVPALAPAELVRRRGEQRRTRTRLAAGAAGLALVFAAGATGYALTANGDPDALQYAPPAPHISTGSDQAGPSVLPGQVDPALLLQTADAKRITGGSWTDLVARETRPQLHVCPAPMPAGEAGSTSVLQLPNDGEAVVSQVVRFGQAGAGIVQAIRGELSRCPTRQGDPQLAASEADFELLPAPAPGVLAIRTLYRECAGCRETVGFWLVTAADRYVSFTGLDAAQESALGKWAAAAKVRLSAAHSP